MKIKTLVGITLAVSLLAPAFTFAQATGTNASASDQTATAAAVAAQNNGTSATNSATSGVNIQGTGGIADLQAQLQALLSQVAALQAQIKAAQTGQGYCHNFDKNLGIGSQGGDVQTLQSDLQKEGLNIPSSELNNGQYGEGTAAAVSGFQEKYNNDVLSPNGLKYGTGYVGQSTRAKLNAVYGCGGTVPPVPAPTPVPCKDINGNTCITPPQSGTVHIYGITPGSGTVGTQVTISGLGFTATDNTVNFGSAQITGLSATYASTNDYSSNARTDNNTNAGTVSSFITFTVPSVALSGCTNSTLGSDNSFYPCSSATNLFAQNAGYPVWVTNANGTSNAAKFIVTGTNGGGTTPGAPSIYGVSGPTWLQINQQGAWVVKASDPNSNNGGLTYSVVWGDEVAGSAATNSSASPSAIQQAATFTHVYASAGTYSPKFTVTNSSGASAQTSLSVVVSATQTSTSTQPSIFSLTPVSGQVGTSVYINGQGFTPIDNTVNFGYGIITGLTSATWMADTATVGSTSISGQTIIFTVPNYLAPGCYYSNPRCMIAAMFTQPGVYPVSVKNANGVSNVVNFTVTASPTSYPNTTSTQYTPSSTSPTSLNVQGSNSATANASDQLNSMAATLQKMLNSLNR